MSEQVNIYSQDLGNCSKCNGRLNRAMSFHNTEKNCENGLTFTYMKIGEAMHAECYIEHVIDTYIEEILLELKKKERREKQELTSSFYHDWFSVTEKFPEIGQRVKVLVRKEMIYMGDQQSHSSMWLDDGNGERGIITWRKIGDEEEFQEKE